jgi:hypothetical protein
MALPNCPTCSFVMGFDEERINDVATPRGRSVAPAMANGMCNWDCPGYALAPYPDDLWPEKRWQFGYPTVPPYKPPTPGDALGEEKKP